MKWLFLELIRGYQRFISPMLPPACRFHPSCSHYTYGAIQIHGPVRGVWMGGLRILRCNPFHPGGFDPVPPLKGSVEPSGPVEH